MYDAREKGLWVNGCGAIMKYERYVDIERDFSEGQLHPLDLKRDLQEERQ